MMNMFLFDIVDFLFIGEMLLLKKSYPFFFCTGVYDLIRINLKIFSEICTIINLHDMIQQCIMKFYKDF